MKLQLYVQQVNGTLEETSQSVLSSMPRVLRDAQLLQQEAQSLMDKMATVKHEIANVSFVFVRNIISITYVTCFFTSILKTFIKYLFIYCFYTFIDLKLYVL